MKKFDFRKISMALVETDRKVAKKLTAEQMKRIEKLVTKRMILKLLPFLKANNTVIYQHEDEVDELDKEIKGWKNYEENKKIINEYAKACKYRYLISELMKVNRHFSNKKRQGAYREILMKNFPRGFIKSQAK